MFRPIDATPGHALEWSRLLVNFVGGRKRHPWLVEAAEQLFQTPPKRDGAG